MDIYVRQSEIKSWKDCRRKTAWQYWDGLTKKESTISNADVGIAVHAGLQAHYAGGQPHTALSDWYDNSPKSEEWQQAYTLASIMVNGYLEWLESTGADAGITITGVEREISVPFMERGEDTVYITGKVDLEFLDRFDRPMLMDHKTVATIGQDIMAVMDEQRLTYAVLRKLEDGTDYQGAIHNQLKRVKRTSTAKPPFYERFSVTYNTEQLKNHWRHMQGSITEMLNIREKEMNEEDTHLYLPPNPGRDCSWKCSYTGMCKLRDDGSDWEAYRDEWYTVNLPVRGRTREEDWRTNV